MLVLAYSKLVFSIWKKSKNASLSIKMYKRRLLCVKLSGNWVSQ